MKKDALLYLIIGLLGGSLLTVIFSRYSFNSNMTGMMQMMGARGNNMIGNQTDVRVDPANSMHMGSSMTQMMESLQGKSGNDFDRAFIEAMTVHHQGAIEMAKEAQTNAGHPELKNLADDIISAQTNEINMMRDWQNQWGF